MRASIEAEEEEMATLLEQEGLREKALAADRAAMALKRGAVK
jgi:hypothetical protein